MNAHQLTSEQQQRLDAFARHPMTHQLLSQLLGHGYLTHSVTGEPLDDQELLGAFDAGIAVCNLIQQTAQEALDRGDDPLTAWPYTVAAVKKRLRSATQAAEPSPPPGPETGP